MGVTGAGLVQGFGRRVTEAGIHLTGLPLGADDVSVLPTWAGRRGNIFIHVYREHRELCTFLPFTSCYIVSSGSSYEMFKDDL